MLKSGGSSGCVCVANCRGRMGSLSRKVAFAQLLKCLDVTWEDWREDSSGGMGNSLEDRFPRVGRSLGCLPCESIWNRENEEIGGKQGVGRT